MQKMIISQEILNKKKYCLKSLYIIEILYKVCKNRYCNKNISGVIMEEKKNIKVRLITVLLVLAIIVIAIMAYFIYKIASEKTVAEEQINTLNSKVDNLQEEINDVVNTTNNVINTDDNFNTNTSTNSVSNNSTSNTSVSNLNQVTELSDEQKRELFNRIRENKEFLQEMVSIKNFSTAEFTDEEILKLLPILDNSTHFSVANTDEGNFAEANVEDVQKLSQQYFGKTFNTNQISEKIKDNIISIEVPSGYGIVNYELVSVSSKGNNEYAITFNYIENESTTKYILTVNWENDNIVYISLEK